MANPIVRGFSKLTQFSGRDTRGEFWPYAAAVFVLFFVTNFILMASMMASLFADMSAFAAAHPDAATVESSPGHYSIQVDGAHPDAPVPDMGLFFVGYEVLIAAIVLLLAAAVTRRLHDRGMTGFWGLLPVPFLAVAMAIMPTMMGSFATEDAPRFDLFGILAVNNMLYLVALGTLIVLLALKGMPGPNRYGAATAAPPRQPVEDRSTPS